MKRSFITLLLIGISIPLFPQDEKPLHEIHSAMLFNFIKYIQWPGEGEAGDFVIGIIGEDDVFKTMKARYEGRQKGSKKFIIKNLKHASEALACHVVYLGKSKNREFENLKTITTGKPTLTITDSSNLGHKGSCINFKVIDGKLKFEINNASINSSNLKVSSQLTGMAILI
jgi:YfiR/HmsC-like